jgi:ATP-dependent helicase/nuclease subunit A
MSKAGKTPRDQPVRDRLVSQFDRNVLVEAGAGSGKTYSLASRMAAGIAAGVYRVEEMAAVTFTRKAAAELRGRFRLALEERLAVKAPAAERARLEAALTGIERLFAGTIHAFCAHLLRERPVDADLAPGFVELDDVEDLRRRAHAWRDYVATARASGDPAMLDLLEAGVRPKDLDEAFRTVCEHGDVEFDPGDGEPPDFDATMKRVEAFWKQLTTLRPAEFLPDTTCEAQQKFDEFDGRLANLRRRHRLSALAGLLQSWGHPRVVQKWWTHLVGRDASYGKDAKQLVAAFGAEVVDPFEQAWWAYVHRLALRVLTAARREYTKARRAQNVVNYVDLLMRTAAMLRGSGEVRRSLQQKYRWLFVDEFQDTDPLQAEIFLMLAGEEPEEPAPGSAAGRSAGRSVRNAGRSVRSAGPSGPAVRSAGPSGPAALERPCDPFTLPLRPGALFVVGDPKQSIYRFRRADIDIYTRVRQRIEATGGQVLSLTANFRSLPDVCALANTVFPPLFAGFAAPYSPVFEPLDAVRDPSDGPAGPRVARLTLAEGLDGEELLTEEARRIAAFIAGEVAARRRTYGDFLILTRQTRRLSHYSDALDACEIPVEVSGAGLFCGSPEVGAFAQLLGALADPLDAVALVGVLRGPLFGLSDPELFQFRQAGGRFELTVPLPEAQDGKEAAAGETRFGPVLPAMRQLQGMLRTTRVLPLAAAVDRILEETGWLALACTTPGGARAGHLLQAVDRVREVVEEGGGLADAADALAEEQTSSEAEALPLRPGRRNVVRLMNLHKAKGLEAPVVFLADPAHAFEFPVVTRVVREGATARGYLRLVKGKPWAPQTIGQPRDWDAHEQEERRYAEAERLRLLYVAGTRAKDLLVVCRIDAPLKKNPAWGVFEGYLQEMPELDIAAGEGTATTSRPDLSVAARNAARRARDARMARVAAASWAVATPTGAKVRSTPAPPVRDVAAGGEVAAAATEASGQRVDAGAAWGTLVHGLLEHAMRHASATRDDLARLALWLTVECPELRPSIPEAIALVEAVSTAPYFQEARAGAEVCVEVPFAVRLEPGQTMPTGLDIDTPTVLRGVIDLAYRTADGWRILDYKTDRLDGVADPQAELQARHGVQLEQYGFAWGRVTDGKGTTARVVRVGSAPARELA